MTLPRSRAARLAAALLLAPVALTPMLATPAQAQWTVFDPTNYVQNVLTAARSLQQITNQITSLQNEAQMLINQARNLASLPYSSLQQLQQSVQRTQQLLQQAQNIASGVGDQHIRIKLALYGPAQAIPLHLQIPNLMYGIVASVRVATTQVGFYTRLEFHRTIGDTVHQIVNHAFNMLCFSE